MVNPQHLRPGNWIYPTGISKYVVVTGLLLGMMEKNPDFCKEFEGIELTDNLAEHAGFEWMEVAFGHFDKHHALYIGKGSSTFHPFCTNDKDCQIEINYLHELQNLVFALEKGRELPLPESALIIRQVTK